MASIITADNGVVSGSAGIKSSADSSGVLALASGTGTTAVTIDTSQNVGIGTSSPAYKLDLSGAIKIGTGTDGGSGNLFLDNGSTFAQYGYRLGWFTGANSARTERMRLDENGNVGIGTSSPSKKLEVGSLGALRLQTGSVTMDCTPTPGGIDGFVWNVSAGYYDWSIGGSSKMRLDSNGWLQLGTTSPSQAGSNYRQVNYSPSLYNTAGGLGIVDGSTTLGGFYIGFVNSSNGVAGAISHNGTSTVAYNTSSDYRLKENVQPMMGALEKVAALKPCTYTWIEDGSDGEGFIAHELAEVCPHAVTGEKDAVNEDGSIKPQGIDTSFLVATLTAAIQEQQALINNLTERLAALEAK